MKKRFITFVPYGYPTAEKSRGLIKMCLKICDYVEIGYPFSDPLADGFLITKIYTQTLKKNEINFKEFTDFLKELSSEKIILMMYLNLLINNPLGKNNFLKACRAAGVRAFIVPDLLFEESKNLKINYDFVRLVTPLTDLKRAGDIVKTSSPFIYYVSKTGTTGVSEKFNFEIKKNIVELKRITDKPVCVGFGVSTPAHVRKINGFADGVIVGSALIKKWSENFNLRETEKFLLKLKKGGRI